MNYLELVLDLLLVPPVSFPKRLYKHGIPNPELHPIMRRSNPVRRQINSGGQILRRGCHHGAEYIAEDLSDDDTTGLPSDEVESAGKEEEGDWLSVLPKRSGVWFEVNRFLSQRRNPVIDAEGWVFFFIGLSCGIGILVW